MKMALAGSQNSAIIDKNGEIEMESNVSVVLNSTVIPFPSYIQLGRI
jgi:hypothetical protein